MTPRDRLVTAPVDTKLEDAHRLLYQNRIEKLPLIDAEGRLAGLITAQDIEKRDRYLNSAKDGNGRFRVGAAIGVGEDYFERARGVIEAGADAVFIYSDGGANHLAVRPERLAVLSALAKKGAGIGMAHYAVEVLADKGGAEWKDWIGGHYDTAFSCNPIWDADYKELPVHPVTRGVKPFRAKDEWYFNMRFRDGKAGVKDLLVATPSDAVRDGLYVHPKGPYAHIQAAKGRAETMMWAVERPDGGRGFGFTGGHFHKNWQNDDQRRLILNSLVWLAKLDVPKGGVDSAPVDDVEIMQNLDEKKINVPKAAAPKKEEAKGAAAPATK
jgi:hypothetical protein